MNNDDFFAPFGPIWAADPDATALGYAFIRKSLVYKIQIVHAMHDDACITPCARIAIYAREPDSKSGYTVYYSPDYDYQTCIIEINRIKSILEEDSRGGA